MGRLLIVNGSPRAPRSNSRRYIEYLLQNWKGAADQYAAVSGGPVSFELYTDLLLVFPLYVDGVPAVLLPFLKTLAAWDGTPRPHVHVLVNCGFLEPEQNQVAVKMVRFFCKRYGFPWGMTLRIGSGEAILDTPFAWFAHRGIRRLAAGMQSGRSEVVSVRMPLSKALFVRASTRYWSGYGAKNHMTAEQMRTMEIEGRDFQI